MQSSNPFTASTALRRMALKTRQAGATLAEVMIVVIILGILAAAIVLNGDTSSAKAVVLQTNLQTIATGLNAMKADMPCYPTRTGALFQQQFAQQSFCNTDLRNRWRQPYIATATVDANGDILLPEVHPNATVTLILANNANGNGNTRQWLAQVTNVPAEVADAFMEKCNGVQGSTGVNPPGKCLRNPANDANQLATVQYIIAEAR